MSYHEFLGHPHYGSYNINTKINFDNVERHFNKATSVFKNWELDSQEANEAGFMDEIKRWKVQELVKDDEEYAYIVSYMKENLYFLKNLFIIKSAPTYPKISW